MSSSGVLTIRMSGLITASRIQATRSDAAAQYGRRLSAAVLDYSTAAVAISADELEAILCADGGKPIGPPCAIVARPDCMKFFLPYSRSMAGQGIVRRLFRTADSADAISWALRQADLQAG